MNKKNNTGGGHAETEDKPPDRWSRFKRWARVRWRWARINRIRIVYWIIVAGLVVGGLITASRYVSGDTDPIQFITGNLLNVLIFGAIVAQVLIYRKQRDIMRYQWRAMNKQLEIMRETLGHSRYAFDQTIQRSIEESVTTQGQLRVMQNQEIAMRDALEETRRSMRYSEAAYIAIKDGLLIQFGADQVTAAKLFYTNAGNTPAYNVRIYGHLNLWEHSLVPTEHDKLKEGFSGIEVSQDVIAPRGERTHTVVSRGALSQELFQNIKAGRLRFCVWGIITYEDIFSRERWTTFCSMQVGGGTALFGCGSNNEADREGKPN